MRIFWALGVLAMMSTGQAAYAQEMTWNLDKAHSEVGFLVKHLAISNVRGKFTDFDAVIKADSKTGRISELSATAKVNSVNTGIEKRDTHLKSDDFFAAAKFPTLTLKTKSITWTGNTFTAVADVTMRGVTKPVTFTGELAGPQKVDFGDGPQVRAGYHVTAMLNRKDFGLAFGGLAEGVAVVADEVKIIIDTEISHKL